MSSDEMASLEWENTLFLAMGYQVFSSNTVHLSRVENYMSPYPTHVPLQADKGQEAHLPNIFDRALTQMQELEAKCTRLEDEISSIRGQLHWQGSPQDSSVQESVENPIKGEENEQHLVWSSQASKSVPVCKSVRRYRRRPKPDSNAPIKPFTAYAAFAMDIRQSYTDQGLSFTEIAKRIGEDWQNLSRDERDLYMGAAQVNRDKYERALEKYVRTKEWREYQDYYQNFLKRESEKNNNGGKRSRVRAAVFKNEPGGVGSPPIDCNATAPGSG